MGHGGLQIVRQNGAHEATGMASVIDVAIDGVMDFGTEAEAILGLTVQHGFTPEWDRGGEAARLPVSLPASRGEKLAEDSGADFGALAIGGVQRAALQPILV